MRNIYVKINRSCLALDSLFTTSIMATPNEPTSSATAPYATLYLYPVDEPFAPKLFDLVNGDRITIGRQTNAKTVPTERNGYFDSKVLSRKHADVWAENGRIYIKDVESANGTYLNGKRLSGECVVSDPFELKTKDVVEFGIDVVGEDNKTIIHHKVAAQVTCVFTREDALAAHEAYNIYQQEQSRL